MTTDLQEEKLYLCSTRTKRRSDTRTLAIGWSIRDVFPTVETVDRWIDYIHEYEPWSATKVKIIQLGDF